MFRTGTALARRVTISHRNGALVIHIKRHNNWVAGLWILVGFTAVFVCFCSIFLKAFLRTPSLRDAMYASPFVAFVLLWYVMGVRIGLWVAFGVEEITVAHGNLQWERTAWKWRRSFSAKLSDISDVQAVIPWHSLSNRVVFTCRGRGHTVGGQLLQDEAKEIAHALSRAIGPHKISDSSH